METTEDALTNDRDWTGIRVRRTRVPGQSYDGSGQTVSVVFDVEVHCCECGEPIVFRANEEAQACVQSFFQRAAPEHQNPPLLANYVATWLLTSVWHAQCPKCRPVQIVTPIKKILEP